MESPGLDLPPGRCPPSQASHTLKRSKLKQIWYFAISGSDVKIYLVPLISYDPAPLCPPAQYIFTCGCYEWINNIYDLVQPTRKATPRYNDLLSSHKSSTFQNLTLPILPIVFHKEGMDFARRKHKSLWGQMPRSIGAMLRLLQK